MNLPRLRHTTGSNARSPTRRFVFRRAFHSYPHSLVFQALRRSFTIAGRKKVWATSSQEPRCPLSRRGAQGLIDPVRRVFVAAEKRGQIGWREGGGRHCFRIVVYNGRFAFPRSTRVNLGGIGLRGRRRIGLRGDG